MNCYGALEGLLTSVDSLEDEGNIRFVALYDNEEVSKEHTLHASQWYIYLQCCLALAAQSLCLVIAFVCCNCRHRCVMLDQSILVILTV